MIGHWKSLEVSGNLLRKALKRSDRASWIAYGGWAVLSLVLACGTWASLWQAERTQTENLLARAAAGAGAVEQTVLRSIESLKTLQTLAQARLRMQEAGDAADTASIDSDMNAVIAAHRFGLTAAEITQPGWPSWFPSSARAATAETTGPDSQAASGSDPDWIAIGAPERGAAPGSWVMRVALPLRGLAGQADGTVNILIDAVAWSRLIATQSEAAGAVATVLRRPDAAVLARSPPAEPAWGSKPDPANPAFVAALQGKTGAVSVKSGGTNRLVGLRAPPGLPVVVTYGFDTQLALAGFYRMRAVTLGVLLGLVAAGFFAARLILANYRLHDRLSKQAMLDPLTGLPNRRYFTDTMTRRFAAARRAGLSAAVLLIDLDGFKQVNDSRGHPVGDALLRQVAERLQKCIGEEDVAMRLGGDEFAIVRLCNQQRRDATALARYIVSALSKVYEVEGYHLRISASVGVSLYPAGGEQLNDMLRSADIALYFVKADGGDAYRIFDPAMEETVRTRRAMEIDLREALVRNQLEVYYQPLVSLDPRRVSGFEALIRWHHPVLGMIMPNRFISIAEETGLIAPIGEWVMRQACREATNWPPNTRIAVNLSPVQFERSDIVDIVTHVLRETRLSPGRLELEITEGVVMRDVGDVLATMRRLQGLGVRLALDDFGTGYSSLSYLRSFPFDKVKIDASFLADLSGDGGTIIRAVLGLCGHLRLDTLVEGVETEEQLNWLRAEGCTEVQGHLFSPPRPAGSITDIIAAVAARMPANLPRSLRVAAEEGRGRAVPEEPRLPALPSKAPETARERAIFDLAATTSRPFLR